MEDLEKLQRAWSVKAGAETGGSAGEPRVTDAGVEIQSLYTPLDLARRNFNYYEKLGFPGEQPFTRGITPGMYRAEPPLIKIYSGFGVAGDCNRRFKKLVEWGADEIQVAVDLPTQVGYDSDHIMATAEIGRVGVAIDSLRDMEILFDGIPLNSLKRVSMLGNSFGPYALALFIALGEKQGLKPGQYVVSLQNDILKEYVARGTQIYPIRPSVKMGCDVVEYCARNHPHWHPMTCCVNHINAAGAGSTAGTAFALANAVCYIEELISRGLQIDQFGHLLDMFLDERDDFFVAVANLRAARRVWAGLMRDSFGARDPKTAALKVTAYSHGRETLQEPLNNIVRIALAGLAYYLGGVQYLYNASFDECTNTPSDESVKVAIRTMQIIFHEFGFRNTIDPLGGSYFLESLTCDIEKGIREELDRVQKLGGAVAAIEKGYFQKVITDGAIRRQRELERGERVSVGVNRFVSGDPLPDATFSLNSETGRRQIENLARLRRERDQGRVREALHHVGEVAAAGGNLVPPVLEAVRAYATIGEVSGVLRSVFGEYESRGDF